MADKIMYWTTVMISFFALLLLVTNLSFISGNMRLQENLGRRQNVIATAQNLAPLNQNLAQALAETSVKYKDSEIRDLLATQGIAIRQPEAGKTAAQVPVTEEKKKKVGE